MHCTFASILLILFLSRSKDIINHKKIYAVKISSKIIYWDKYKIKQVHHIYINEREVVL